MTLRTRLALTVREPQVALADTGFTCYTMHAVLAHIFVCITFHWDPLLLLTLQSTLDGLAAYPTNVTVSVVSNEPEKVSKVLKVWSADSRLPLCALDVDGPSCSPEVLENSNFRVTSQGPATTLEHPFDLSWVHRSIFAGVAHKSEYTLFLLLEDDMYVPFHAIQAWAIDTDRIRSKNKKFQRGFYRTIIDAEGDVKLSDATSSENFDKVLRIGGDLFAQMPFLIVECG